MSVGFGKWVGATFGLFTGGPFGALVGFISGSLLDDAFSKMLRRDLDEIRGNSQQVFYRALFRSMGRLAKADGRVSEQEIKAASDIMERMGLRGEQRNMAIHFFTEGKEHHCNVEADLQALRPILINNPTAAFMFLELLLAVAYADGQFSQQERQFFQWLCPQLGVSSAQFEQLHQSVLGGEQGAYQRGANWQPSGGGRELTQACKTLGVSTEADFAEIKKAYRRLMSQHHPDKLMATGANAKQIEQAKETTQKIQNAYDFLQKIKR